MCRKHARKHAPVKEDESTIDLSNLLTSEEESTTQDYEDPVLDDADSSEDLPGLVIPEDADTRRTLQKWDEPDHPIRKLLYTIQNEPDVEVMDPGWCQINCAYSTGSLQTQRYVLLKRLYVIQTVLDRKPLTLIRETTQTVHRL